MDLLVWLSEVIGNSAGIAGTWKIIKLSDAIKVRIFPENKKCEIIIFIIKIKRLIPQNNERIVLAHWENNIKAFAVHFATK